MKLKLWLPFLMLCVIPDIQSKEQWSIVVPSQIPAVQYSCVVIPCRYTYVPRPRIIPTRWNGFWWRGKNVVSTSLRQWRYTKEFNGRTKFVGSTSSGNCTMVLQVVKSTDVGPFHFQVDLPEYRKSHSFTNNPVFINVTRNPEPPSLSVTVTDKVTAVCSVSHSCPYKVPRLSWNRAGKIRHRTKKLNQWKWQIQSELTYYPRSRDINTTLSCTVTYSGGKQAQSSTIPWKIPKPV